MIHDRRVARWLAGCVIAALGCVQSAAVQREEHYEEHTIEEEPLDDAPDEAAQPYEPEPYEPQPAEPQPAQPQPQPAQRATCPAQQLVPPELSGGCNIRLVTPAQCEVVELRGGRTYEVAWTTDGTRCETPWTLSVAGDPLTEQNLRVIQLSTNTEAGITSYGGILRISAADLDGLTSATGLYHWSVSSFHGSHPGSHTFQALR
jgi:hypothetical protein